MRELSKKVGSLALGVGALSLLLANAAFTHGCGGSRPDPVVTQVEVPAPVNAEHRPAAAPAEPASAGDDCGEPEYMHATKAPVWMTERNCRDGTTGDEKGAAERAPPGSANAERQAP